MDSYLIFRQDSKGERCFLNPGTYTIHGRHSMPWTDTRTGAYVPEEEALIEIKDGRCFLASRTASIPFAPPDPSPPFDAWDSVRAVDLVEAAEWLLGYGLALPDSLRPVALGYDLIEGVVAEPLEPGPTAEPALDDPPPPGAEEWTSREPRPRPPCCVELLDPYAEFSALVFGRKKRLKPNTEYKIVKALVDSYLNDERLDNAALEKRSGVKSPDTYLRRLRNRDRDWRAAILPNGDSKPGKGENTRNWWTINPDACPPPDFPDFNPTSPE